MLGIVGCTCKVQPTCMQSQLGRRRPTHVFIKQAGEPGNVSCRPSVVSLHLGKIWEGCLDEVVL